MKMPRHVCYLVMTPYTPSACHLSPAPNGSRVGLQSRKWATPSSVPSLLSCPAGTAGVGGPLPSDLLVEQAGQNSGRSHSLACYVGTPALGVFTLSYTTALPLPSDSPSSVRHLSVHPCHGFWGWLGFFPVRLLGRKLALWSLCYMQVPRAPSTAVHSGYEHAGW